MSDQQQPRTVSVTLTLTEDGDVDIVASEALDYALMSFIIGLADYKLNMSHFGMVYRQIDEKRKEEQRSKPQILIPR